jgi:hypothetical protein
MNSGTRDFDILIASHDALELLQVLTELGVQNCVIPVSDLARNLPTARLPISAYLRLQLCEHFAGR